MKLARPRQSKTLLADPGGVSYVTSWALSWGNRGSRFVRRQWRKLSNVRPGFWFISIRSCWVQASRPTSATRTFIGLKNWKRTGTQERGSQGWGPAGCCQACHSLCPGGGPLPGCGSVGSGSPGASGPTGQERQPGKVARLAEVGEGSQGLASSPRNGQPQSPAQQSWSLSPRPASTVDKRKARQTHPPVTTRSHAQLARLCPHPPCAAKVKRVKSPFYREPRRTWEARAGTCPSGLRIGYEAGSRALLFWLQIQCFFQIREKRKKKLTPSNT